MNRELIKQATAMFDCPEKWNAFVELVSEKDAIVKQWFLKLREEAERKFLTGELVEGWAFRYWDVFGWQWYQTEHGAHSVSLLIERGEMMLWFDPEFYDTTKIHHLVRSERFAPLLSCFNRLDKTFDGQKLAVETRNFSFNSPYDTQFDYDRLAWYAGNRTEDVLDQITAKVNKFRRDERITSLLGELNRQTKKQ